MYETLFTAQQIARGFNNIDKKWYQWKLYSCGAIASKLRFIHNYSQYLEKKEKETAHITFPRFSSKALCGERFYKLNQDGFLLLIRGDTPFLDVGPTWKFILHLSEIIHTSN